MAKSILVVDYGIGNVYSVLRALEVGGAEKISVSNESKTIDDADGLVLPGVGAFGNGMRGLRDRGLIEPIVNFARSGRPLLGICLGMQLLATSSVEFGSHDGLDLIPGEVVPIPNRSVNGQLLKVPFVGWAGLSSANEKTFKNSVLQSQEPMSAIYLVHSFHMLPTNPDHLLATYCLGGHHITAAIQRDNVIGLQFHPERSGRVGLSIIRNFVSQV